jgi:hypothetical protein
MPLHPDSSHLVKFYVDPASLFKTVATFLGHGFGDGHPAVIIATPVHTAAIIEEMRQLPADIEAARRAGTLVVLDARKTLDTFMVGGRPDPRLFERSVGGIVRDLIRNGTERRLIRAYGEMVDVLWKENRTEAAIRLEMLWNGLAERFGFALLCGYSMGNFYKQTHLLEDVCRQHSEVLPPDPIAAIPA